jgi:lysophospholipase L1-like esterase
MIYAIGDSFTYGDELSNQDLAWPSILSKKINKSISNLGRSASGNTRIVKRAIDAVLDKSEMVIIGWSDCNRQEFADDIGTYDIWAGRNYKAFQLDDPTHRINLIKYMTAHDTPEYFYAQWLRQIILVQNLCKSYQIPCVMFIACGAHYSHQQYHNEFNKLVDAIDQSTFVDKMFTSVGEWTYGTPHGPNGHPLEQGHEIIADKIYEHIRNKCWIS